MLVKKYYVFKKISFAASLLYCNMDFCDELKANNIDPDKFIPLLNEFILYARNANQSNAKTITFREYNERDQLITTMEKFCNRLERERLKQ